MNVFIEFFGLAGSGKSTLVNLACEEKKSILENVDCIYTVGKKKPKFLKMFSIFCFFIIHPIKSFKALIAILQSSQSTFMDFIKVLVNWLNILSLFYSKKKIIIDQGLFQAFWSVQLTAKKTNFFNDYFEKSILNKSKSKIFIFIIDINAHTSKDRILRRDNDFSRIKKEYLLNNDDFIMRSYSTFNDIKKNIFEYEKKLSFLKVFHLKNESESDSKNSLEIIQKVIFDNTK